MRVLTLYLLSEISYDERTLANRFGLFVKSSLASSDEDDVELIRGQLSSPFRANTAGCAGYHSPRLAGTSLEGLDLTSIRSEQNAHILSRNDSELERESSNRVEDSAKEENTE